MISANAKQRDKKRNICKKIGHVGRLAIGDCVCGERTDLAEERNKQRNSNATKTEDDYNDFTSNISDN